jgi:hypothetical protein
VCASGTKKPETASTTGVSWASSFCSQVAAAGDRAAGCVDHFQRQAVGPFRQPLARSVGRAAVRNDHLVGRTALSRDRRQQRIDGRDLIQDGGD